MNMTANLIDDLEFRGARFAFRGKRLIARPPEGGFSAHEAAVLRDHRLGVLAILEEREERRVLLAGIREDTLGRFASASDPELQAIIDWHVVNAFLSGGASRFREHLPRALRRMTDAQLVMLVDWAGIATFERQLTARNPSDAPALRKATHDLAVWWIKHHPRPEDRLAAQKAADGSHRGLDLQGGMARPQLTDSEIGAQVRRETFRLAADAGFPRLPYAPPRVVAAGEQHWSRFVSANGADEVALAGDLLRSCFPIGRVEVHAYVTADAEVARRGAKRSPGIG